METTYRHAQVSEEASMKSTPDLTQPIIAWRQWQVEGTRLRSVFWKATELGDPWVPRQPAIAEGLQHNPLAGLYARKAPPKLIDPTVSPSVIGRVALWGIVHEHRKGY